MFVPFYENRKSELTRENMELRKSVCIDPFVTPPMKGNGLTYA